MNSLGSHTIKRFLSLLFVAILLSPIWISLSHELNDHEHPVCKTAKTHVHAQPLDCDLCDFSLQSFTFDPIEQDFESTTIGFERTVSAVNSQFWAETRQTRQGRAPPRLC